MYKGAFSKKILVFLVLSFLFAHLSFAEDATRVRDNSYLAIGPGFGIPYGIIGGSLEVTPDDHFSLSGGIGYCPGGVGYSFGARIYPVGRSRDFFLSIGAYYGIVAVIETIGAYHDYDHVGGFAFGVGGVWWKSKLKFSIDFDLMWVLPNWPSSVAKSDKGFPLRLSFGFKWHFTFK